MPVDQRDAVLILRRCRSGRQFDTVKLKQIGCSNSDDTVTVGEVRNPPPKLTWFSEFGSALLLSPLPQTLIGTLAVYVVVRAVGWVIGGFAAS
jgi:hypothetical protein